MSVISWGKPTLKFAASVAGSPSGAWNLIDTPKEGTTKLSVTAGTEVTAVEEGGEIVDSRNGKNTYQFEFDLFVKKGVARPFVDNDGIIAGEYALRVIPEDTACEGIQIDRCSLRVEESYSVEEGKLLHYVARGLKPASGKTVKPYTENALSVTPGALYFSAAADSSGKAITATATGNVSATASEAWITVTCATQVATVKVTANESGVVRSGYVTVTADDKTAIVEVTQIP